MATRRSVAMIEIRNEAGYSIARIRESDRLSLEKHVFQRYPHREWGTFFRFGWRRTAWGLAISFIDSFLPGPGDLDRQTGLTTFRDQYSLRAFQAAESSRPIGWGVVHSHPVGFATTPSALDDDMDTYFAREFSARTGGAPYCSLIFQRSAEGFTFSGRVYLRGEWIAVQDLITVGSSVDRQRSELVADDEMPEGSATVLRLEGLIGSKSVKRLRRSVVGVIGCSGTGSPAIHTLARARLGGFVLVDPQRLDHSNVERLHGSYQSHLSGEEFPYKVDVVSDLISAINPDARVTGLVGNILHENVLDELLQCDLLIGATDLLHGRVAQSDFAKHYLLPSIDIGVRMAGQEGRIREQVVECTKYSPDSPCIFCDQRIDANELAIELMTDEERAMRQEQGRLAVERGDNPDHYWRGIVRELHTVG